VCACQSSPPSITKLFCAQFHLSKGKCWFKGGKFFLAFCRLLFLIQCRSYASGITSRVVSDLKLGCKSESESLKCDSLLGCLKRDTNPALFILIICHWRRERNHLHIAFIYWLNCSYTYCTFDDAILAARVRARRVPECAVLYRLIGAVT
jgi:hypothetical protein